MELLQISIIAATVAATGLGSYPLGAVQAVFWESIGWKWVSLLVPSYLIYRTCGMEDKKHPTNLFEYVKFPKLVMTAVSVGATLGTVSTMGVFAFLRSLT